MLLRRASTVSCYFCNTSVPAPQNKLRWTCPHCDALNNFVDGNLHDPAMFNESLNKRGVQRRDRLPEFTRNILCHECKRNGALVMQLLANWDGPEDDDARFEEYRQSIESRYPLVCDLCRSDVEAEIHKKNTMARSAALGAWLNQTKGKTKQRLISPQEAERISRELFAWRVRGCLWAATALICLLCNMFAGLGYWPPTFRYPSIMLSLNAISLSWMFWNPTYSAFRSAKKQGRDVRVRGQNKHITLQLCVWIWRLGTAALLYAHSSRGLDILHFPSMTSRVYFAAGAFLELLSAFLPFFVLRLQQPPQIRLIDTNSHKHEASRSRSHTPAPGPEPDLFAGLSFSSQPPQPSPHKVPVFGVSSMPSTNVFAQTQPQFADDDQMDIDPPAGAKPKQSDPVWLRPQRFFAPEAPTGLEHLFEQTKIVDSNEDVTMADASTRPGLPRMWLAVSFAIPILAAIAGLVYKLRRGTPLQPLASDTLLHPPLVPM
ncbi:Ima1-N domain-containing protein [Mycena kentingensis (nom. inval.)]|nr:Ima1-N domain-containing protein [Mycena kentingensis (nom. inval.)]